LTLVKGLLPMERRLTYPRSDQEKKLWKLAGERVKFICLHDLPQNTIARIAYIKGLTDARDAKKSKQERELYVKEEK